MQKQRTKRSLIKYLIKTQGNKRSGIVVVGMQWGSEEPFTY